ncbi:MAG: hypothetical protein AB7S51_07690 [Porticoccaceae bacterium]
MDECPCNLAALILKKGEERCLLASHLWIYSNEIDTARDTRQGARSAVGSDGADHRAEIQSMSQVEPPHQLRLTTTGREIAGLVRGGQGSFSGKRGFILPILRLIHAAVVVVTVVVETLNCQCFTECAHAHASAGKA